MTATEQTDGGESLDRLPPNDPHAEQAVLGAVMLDAAIAMPECIKKIANNHEAFYDLRNQLIYRVMVEMYDVQEPIDLLTLSNWLKFQSIYDQVGGLEYIGTLPDACPSASNVSYHIDILLEKDKYRKLIRISTDAVATAFGGGVHADDLVSRVSSDLMSLAEKDSTEEQIPMPQLIAGCIDQLEQWHQHQGQLSGLATGLLDLDKLTTGLQPGEMIVIAARPSMGKTALAMNIVDHVAVELGLPVGVFSLEMTSRALAMRMICSRARVNIRRLSDGFMAETDFPKITSAAVRLHQAPIHINDAAGLSILGLRTRARQMHQQHGIKLLVIDYLQLISADRRGNQSRQEEVSIVSSGCKAIAKELGIPVIVNAQLNREMEKEKNRKPKLSDLRESGSIEQDADLVGMLYRPKWDPDDGEPDENADRLSLYVAKQRNGPTGDVALTFMKCYTRFESASRVDDSDVPSQPSGQQEFDGYHQQPDP